MTTYQGTDEFEGATFVKTSFRGATWRYADRDPAMVAWLNGRAEQ